MAPLHIKKNTGQTLAEIIVSLGIAFILVGSAAMLVSVTLRASASNKYLQSSSFLAQDLMEKLVAFAEGKWYCPSNCTANYGIANLLKGSTNTHYISTSANPFTWVGPGATETTVLDGVTYSRSFFIDEVCRDATSGAITTESWPACLATQKDLSTLLAVVVVAWTEQGQSQSFRLTRYLIHDRNNQVFVQTDWSGVPTGSPPQVVTVPNNKFETSTNITSGSSIQITSGLNGNLTSSVFDTCITGSNCGAAINTIMWNGASNGGAVKFQIASSDCPNAQTNYSICDSPGSWSFVGSDGTNGTYYQPTSSGLPLDLKYDDHKNKRYVRYKVFLDAVGASPVVYDIIINWTP